MQNQVSLERPVKPFGMNPYKFTLWLFIISIVMFFAALTSAYLVKQASGNWQVINMPTIFWYSSLAVVLSSACMQLAYFWGKKGELANARMAIVLTFALGIVFIWLQWQGWGKLVMQEVFLNGNPAGSFIYVITGTHGLHIISGMVFLLIVMIKTFNKNVKIEKLQALSLCKTYWHFLGVLWLYLFFFLLLSR